MNPNSFLDIVDRLVVELEDEAERRKWIVDMLVTQDALLEKIIQLKREKVGLCAAS